MIETLKTDKYNRFFAGLPNIPKKDKNKMAIYETFLQHVISSLSDKGKAAIVVPTGFVSASTGIPKKIRKKLIDMNWLRGVVHMPSNIFATTGTSVSILFIDKTKDDDKVMLMDASNLGTKIKLDDGQRTILSDTETDKIITFFKNRREEAEFSVLVKNEDIKENDYSLQAGQYVELIIEELGFDIEEKLSSLSIELKVLLEQSNDIDKTLRKILEDNSHE